MGSIRCFEEIDAWKESRVLTKMVYSVTQQGKFSKDWELARQIQKSSVSIMSNVAEGFDGGSKAEFVRFLGYARRSASEVQSHLYVVLDQSYLTEETFTHLYQHAQTVRKMVTSFMKYLQAQRAVDSSIRSRSQRSDESVRLLPLTREPVNPKTR